MFMKREDKRGTLSMYEERWYMAKLKTADGRSFQISIANRKEHMVTLRMAARGILLVRDVCGTKGYLQIFDRLFLKIKGSLPWMYKIFESEVLLA